MLSKEDYSMNSSMRYLMNKPKVIHEVFEDEVVIINLDSGSYYSVDKVGAEIWRLIEGGATVGKVVELTTQRYESNEVNIENVINQFLEELQREDLIIHNEEIEVVTPKGPEIKVEAQQTAKRPDFEKPILHKYTDMQELLLLDPIHGVDETGWPRTKPDFSDGNG